MTKVLKLHSSETDHVHVTRKAPGMFIVEVDDHQFSPNVGKVDEVVVLASPRDFALRYEEELDRISLPETAG